MKVLQPLCLIACATLALNTIMADPKTNTEPADNVTCDKNACAIPSNAEISEENIAHKRTDEEWKKILTPNQFRVLRKQGTEPPFRNEYWNHKEKGAYKCAGCGVDLFSSDEKFDSGTGWPSFYDTVAPANVGETRDTSHGMVRVEVHCSKCGGHLGHLFPDGPKPTGQRYCINSASIKFEESPGAKKD